MLSSIPNYENSICFVMTKVDKIFLTEK